MKVTVKTLTGANFALEIDASSTVAATKEAIAASHPFPADRQRLIYAGKVLKDDDTLEAAGVKENDFLVCMVSKKKADAPAPAPAPAAAAAAAPAPAAAAAPAPAAAAPAPASASAPAPAPAAASASAPAPAPAAAANTEAVANLVAMGFPEEEVKAALAAAFNNQERAVEYLMTGIPEGARAAAAAAASAPATGAPAAASSSGGGAAAAAAASGGDPLAVLRSHPQINQLRRLVQANPSALPMVLQQIGQASPPLLELINANRAAFVELMNEPVGEDAAGSAGPAAPGAAGGMGGMPGMPPGMNPAALAAALGGMSAEQRASMAEAFGISPEQLNLVAQMMAARAAGGEGGEGGEGGAPPGSVVIRLTEAENAAIERLMGMGFERNQVIEAFLACDRNEELAANFLLENMN